MAVQAITADYEKHIEYRDVKELYHGNLIVYVHWEEHISFVSAFALPLPPATPFGALTEIVASVYGPHPDFAKIDWSKVTWMIDGKAATPDLGKSIEENGVGHKSLIRFWTPGLDGFNGSKN
ncbi:MAG: phenol hydroxylase subunit P4 [Acidobacteriaceae bacterium]|nr:phenol hydroxylase subunit P4 [Acidobacteriaceae bacterium]